MWTVWEKLRKRASQQVETAESRDLLPIKATGKPCRAKRRRFFAFVCISAILLASGCSGPKRRVALVTSEERSQIEFRYGLEVASGFDLLVEKQNVSEVKNWIENLLYELAEHSKHLDLGQFEVVLIQNLSSRIFSFPGHRFYVPWSLLRKLEFENEWAAAFALELAHIEKRTLFERIYQSIKSAKEDKKTQRPLSRAGGSGPAKERASKDSKGQSFDDPYYGYSPDEFEAILGLPAGDGMYRPSASSQYLGEGGLFDFEDQQFRSALSRALELMRQLGYDLRGMQSLLNKMKSLRVMNINRHSRFDRDSWGPELFDEWISHVRRDIAQLPPLRNPRVRSESFVKMYQHHFAAQSEQN